MGFIENTVAKAVVKSRIKTISQKAGMDTSKLYVVINSENEKGDFTIWLYSKDDLSKPIREIQLSELLV